MIAYNQYKNTLINSIKGLSRTKKIALLTGLTYLALGHFLNYRMRGPSTKFKRDLQDRVAIITECSEGVGREIAFELARNNATIILACKDQQSAQKLIDSIKLGTNNENVYYMALDTSSYQSVYTFVDWFKGQFKQLDLLINNASSEFKTIQYNEQNHELTYATNHLGPFLLTNLLLDVIAKTSQSRVINITSFGNEHWNKQILFDQALNGSYKGYIDRFNISKVCDVLFTRALQGYFDKHKIEAKSVCVDIGVVRSELKDINPFVRFVFFIMVSWILLSPKQGAMTAISASLMNYEDLTRAGYYQQNQLGKCTRFILGCNQEEQLWSFNCKALGIQNNL